MPTLYASRTDSNHAEIREGVRKAGYEWYDTYQLGKGFPDGICVSKSGIPVLVEIKMPGKSLTEDERAFFHKYTGPIVKVFCVQELLDVMAMYDRMEIG